VTICFHVDKATMPLCPADACIDLIMQSLRIVIILKLKTFFTQAREDINFLIFRLETNMQASTSVEHGHEHEHRIHIASQYFVFQQFLPLQYVYRASIFDPGLVLLRKQTYGIASCSSPSYMGCIVAHYVTVLYHHDSESDKQGMPQESQSTRDAALMCCSLCALILVMTQANGFG